MKKYIIGLLSLFTLFSCKDNDDINGETLLMGEYPLIFSTNIEGVTTKTSGNDAWLGGETVGVKIDDADIVNYTVNSDKISLYAPEGSEEYWTHSTQTKKISAWYPATEVTNKDISDQSGGLTDIDFLYASTDIDYTTYKQNENKVNLTFKHSMAKIVVNLTNSEGFISDLSSVEVLIYGVSKVSYGSQQVTLEEIQTYDMIKPYSVDADTKEIIVPESTLAQDVEFIKVIADNKTYLYKLPQETTFNPAHKYIYNIDILADKIVLESSSITDWSADSNPRDDNHSAYRKYSIGDIYYDAAGAAIGVVCDVNFNSDGYSGKIISLDEPPANFNGGANSIGKLPWSTAEYKNISGTFSSNNGTSNMYNVWQNKAPVGFENYPAFQWVDSKNTKRGIDTHNYDFAPKGIWYFPARNDISYVTSAEIVIINQTLTDNGWTQLSTDYYGTSNQYSTEQITLRKFGDFNDAQGTKKQEYNIRAMMEFDEYTVIPPIITYAVGDIYPKGATGDAIMGVVSEITDGGTKGKIVSINSTNSVWSNVNESTGANSNNDGINNMKKVWDIDNDYSNYPAFKWVHDKNTAVKTSFTGGEYVSGAVNIWYLPVKTEIENAIYNASVREVLGINLPTTFLTSQEYSYDRAYCATAQNISYPKSAVGINVRAMMQFDTSK